MYSFPSYKERDYATILEFVRSHPFAMLLGCSDGQPVATQVPFLIEEARGHLILRGHMIRKTDHHKAFEENPRALCLFSGAHTYVSASWYSNPQIGSTWNYMSVHARGKLRFLDGQALLAILEQTTALFEKDENSPSLFRHLPQTYVDSMTKAIIAFEIEVESLENVFKLSQDRDRQSYDNIIRHLHAQGGDAAAIADEMTKRQARLFDE